MALLWDRKRKRCGESEISRRMLQKDCRAQVCRAEAELTGVPGRRQERLETARAYERMADRAKRHLGLTK